MRQAPPVREALCRRGGVISSDAAGFCAGTSSFARRFRALAAGYGQFRRQYHASNPRLSRSAPGNAQPRLWRALRVYWGWHDRLSTSRLARRPNRRHLGDRDDRPRRSAGYAADPALVARDRTVIAEIV